LTALFPTARKHEYLCHYNAYHDFVGEEVGECWDSLFANIDLHVDGQVLKPHFYCRVLNPNSTKNILRK
jgi:hypothetical protein